MDVFVARFEAGCGADTVKITEAWLLDGVVRENFAVIPLKLSHFVDIPVVSPILIALLRSGMAPSERTVTCTEPVVGRFKVEGIFADPIKGASKLSAKVMVA